MKKEVPDTIPKVPQNIPSDTPFNLKSAPKGSKTGEHLGPYKVLEELGRGGMGIVYRVHREDLDRDFALKVIRAGEDIPPEAVTRFRREARAAAILSSHPGIVAVHDIGEHNGAPYFAMDLVKGKSLDEMITEDEVNPRQAAKIMIEVANALHFAHKKGILHRDIKPGNILIDDSGQVRVTDFGLVKHQKNESVNLTTSGMIVGTVSYMSPEQAEGSTLDARSEVYLMGATLYEALVGSPPFEGGNPIEVLSKILRGDSPRLVRKRDPRVPRQLETIVMKCLENKPKDRYETAKELADDLSRHIAGESIIAKPPGIVEQGWRLSKRHPVLATACGIGTLGLVIGGLVFSSLSGRYSEQSEKETAARLKAQQNLAAAEIAADRELRLKKEADPYFQKGDNFFNDKDYRSAIDGFTSVLGITPNDAQALYLRGRSYRKLGNLEKALSDFDESIKLRPNHALTRYQRVVVLGEFFGKDLSLERLAQSKEDTCMIRKLGIAEEKASLAEAVLRRYQGDLETALSMLNKLLAEKPFFEAALFQRARLHNLLGSLEEEIRDYESHLELDPKNHRAINNLGTAYMDCGNHKKAEKMFRKANAIRADPRTSYNLGRLLLATGQIKESIDELTKALEMEPRLEDRYDIVVERAEAYMERGDLELALAECDTAAKIIPDRDRAYSAKGNILFGQGEYEKAIEEYRIAQEKNPESELAFINAGVCFLALGKYGQAQSDLEKAIGLNPKEGSAYKFLGVAYNGQGKAKQAIEAWKKGMPHYDPSDREMVEGQIALAQGK